MNNSKAFVEKKKMTGLWGGDRYTILRHKCMSISLYSLKSLTCLVCLSIFKLK